MKNRLERPIHVRGYDEPGKDQVTVFFLPGYGYAEARRDVPDDLPERDGLDRDKGGNGSGISVSVMATVSHAAFCPATSTRFPTGVSTNTKPS